MIDRTTPIQTIAAGSGVSAIAVGNFHACAVINGGVRCWGSNASWQLGIYGVGAAGTAQPIAAGSGVTAVAASSYHTCVTITGGVRCWGRNEEGSLGDGSVTNRASPVQSILSGSGVTTATASSYTCAVVNGGLVCFGLGTTGTLGSNIEAPYGQIATVRLLNAPSTAIPPVSPNVQPINRYRIYIPTARGHLYTTDANEYNYLTTNFPALYQGEGIAHQVFKTAATREGQTAVAFYRLFIKTIGQHFWTTDANEYNVLRAQTQFFADDGVDSYIFLRPGVIGTIPLYRLVLANTALHVWTTDANEFNYLRNNGWVAEGEPGNPIGVIGYVFPKP